MLLKELMNHLETLYPLSYAEEWDNVGLIIGDPDREVRRVRVCMELTQKILDSGIEDGIDLFVTHHPPLFSSFKTIDYSTHKGSIVSKLIKNDLAVYSMHTNLDNAPDGLSDWFADLFDYKTKEVFLKTGETSLYKLKFFVPEEEASMVTESLFELGCGKLGNYESCSFATKGIGTFKPVSGASPYIGTFDQKEEVLEQSVEMLVSDNLVKQAIHRLMETHPYEEVAYDLYALENKMGEVYGTGRLLELKNEQSIEEIVGLLKEKLSLDYTLYLGDKKAKIKKVAIVQGEGNEFAQIAIDRGVDLYITGDMKFHYSIDAYQQGLNILNITHEAEELFTDKMIDIVSFEGLEVSSDYTYQIYEVL